MTMSMTTAHSEIDTQKTKKATTTTTSSLLWLLSSSFVIVVVAVLVAFLWKNNNNDFENIPYLSCPREEDHRVRVSINIEDYYNNFSSSSSLWKTRGGDGGDEGVNPCRVFSRTYEEARSKFRTAATAAGAELFALPVVVVDDDSKKEQKYTIDVAVLWSNSNNNNSSSSSSSISSSSSSSNGLTVHTSGVHGVEGYAGSAIQVAFLESLALHPPLSLSTVVLVHAVNPYGMAHYRRTNENNVDLNRNALHDWEWEELMLEEKKNTNGRYEAYRNFDELLFNPRQFPTTYDYRIGSYLSAMKGLILHGFDALKVAMVTGQYYQPQGIFYGGNQLQTSHRVLYNFFANEILPRHDSQNNNEGGKSKGMVTWVDVHTGLGKSGTDSIMGLGHSASDDDRQWWFRDAQFPGSSKNADAVTKGYELTRGITPGYYIHLFAAASSIWQDPPLMLMQEFGTLPGILVAHALIIENMAYNHQPPTTTTTTTTTNYKLQQERIRWAKKTTLPAFYRWNHPSWRKKILERGLTILMQSILRSSSPMQTTIPS